MEEYSESEYNIAVFNMSSESDNDQKDKAQSADEAVKKGLSKVKISKKDAQEMENELKKVFIDEWSESYEVMKASRIPNTKEKLHGFLDHVQRAYEGIDPNLRIKMEGIIHSGSWEYLLVEWKLTKSEAHARYGIIAFGKSPDDKYIDCKYVMYKMDFKIAPRSIAVIKNHSILWGLIKWQTVDNKTMRKQMNQDEIQLFQNFFRHKALIGFYREGVIESISYVSSLEYIPQSDPF